MGGLVRLSQAGPMLCGLMNPITRIIGLAKKLK